MSVYDIVNTRDIKFKLNGDLIFLSPVINRILYPTDYFKQNV